MSKGKKMIHHAQGPYHYAHIPEIGCTRDACKWEILDEDEDGKCAWCRMAEGRLEVRMEKIHRRYKR